MSKKKSVLTPPSPQAVQLLIQQAASAPLQNMQHAVAVQQAINEISAFFRQLQAAGSSKPQASASSGGSSSDQS